jgi:hypothetical protein
MALGTPVLQSCTPPNQGAVTYTGQFLAVWQTICTDPTASDGNPVLKPGSLTRAALSIFKPNGKGKTLLVRMKYDPGVTGVTSPIIQVFGRDHNGIWMNLPDAAASITSTLTATVGTDVQNDDGTFSYTPPKSFDLLGCVDVLVCVKTAFAASGGTINNSTLEAKAY